jgi:uncharacterized protein YcbK (DUF882 family)
MSMITRRDFLKLAAGSALTTMVPPAFARTDLLEPTKGERVLDLQSIHTGEKISATYWADGSYIPEEIAEIDRVLRDHRSNEVMAMDHKLYDLLYTLQQQVEKPGTYQIISGYRSPATNEKLRGASSGVAKRSLHMRGKAVDIRLPGVELKHLRQAALSLRAGGVGYYPRSNFIHVDTGRPRFW